MAAARPQRPSKHSLTPGASQRLLQPLTKRARASLHRRPRGSERPPVSPSSTAARDRDVLCLAHVTSTMAVSGGDFEKGQANGALAAIAMTAVIAHVLQARLGRP